MSAASFSILAGLGLFFYGLRKLLRGLESFASSKVRPTLQRAFSKPLSSWLSGAGLTLFSQSSNLTVIFLMGLTEIGFVNMRSAYFAMLGASAGTTAWLWFALSDWHMGPLLLAIGSFGLILAKTEYWEELMSAVLSIGLALLGLELLYSGASELSGGIIAAKIISSSGTSDLLVQLPFVMIGLFLGLTLQSASAPLVMILTLPAVTNITLATGIALYLGANLGLTFTALILSRGTRVFTRRLVCAYFVTKAIGTTGAMLFFPTFLLFIERIAGWFASEPNLLTQLVIGQLLFNLINSLIFGVLAEPMMRILAHFFPEKQIRHLGLAKRVRRMLYQDPNLAAQELRRQLRLLELEVKANYDQVLTRLEMADEKDSFKKRALRERNFRSLKFTIHDLLFSVDRHTDERHDEGAVLLSLLEYYGALTRTLFHLEDHYEKGLSKKFRLPAELQEGLAHFKSLLDEMWHETLLASSPISETEHTEAPDSLEEIVLSLNKRLGVEYQGYSTWLMETAGYLRLISSDLGQLVQRRAQLRTLLEE